MKFLLAVSVVLSIVLANPAVAAQDKVTICHKPGTPAEKTLTLPPKAAERHIAAHGDTRGACPPRALPAIAPPATAEASRAIRDRFSWEATRPVPEFRGPDPTLFYALINIRDDSDLEALEELAIHWDTVPLFAEERDRWIEQTGNTTPIFDGEGGFVFAVIPGITFNLLREAALCDDPSAVDEVLQVVQLRQIPVPEARERDGSLSYRFLATEGFQYRGLVPCEQADPDDPETLCAPEEETRRVLLQERPDVCALDTAAATGDVQALGLGLGKLAKRFSARVVRIVNGAKDLARRGLSRFAGLFKGEVTLELTLETHNTDPGFGGRDSIMRRPWGAARNSPVPLPAVQVRVFQNITYRFRFRIPATRIPGTDFRTPNIIADTGERTFPVDGLSTGRTNANGFARLRVVRNSRARVCARLENEAARVLDWVLPTEACAFQVCDAGGNCAERIAAAQLRTDAAFTARLSDERLNILTQTSEGRAYLQEVAQYRPKRAEVMVGFFANTISQSDGLGDDRAFAPCFGFPNWNNPYAAILRTLGQLAGRQLGREVIGPILRRGADLAAEGLDGFAQASERWAAARLAAAGTSAEAAVTAAADAVNNARDSALASAQAAAAAAQAGRDITEAAEQLLLAQRRGNQAVIAAAAARLEQTVPDANTAIARARSAQLAAASAADDALTAVNAAVAAAENTAAAAAALSAATASRAAAALVQASGEILARGSTVGLELVGLAAGQLVGLVVTDLFDVILADVDLVIPSGPSRRSRGVVTHEYGHFVLCDMMYRTSPFKFGSAWTKTIADTVAKQALGLDRRNDENAFINEAFADFLTGQVAAGVNYFTPIGSASAFRDQAPVWHDPMEWCGPTPPSGNPLRCLDDNFGAGPGPTIPGTTEPKQLSPNSMTGDTFEDGFRDQVARITTILHDAFDGHPNTPAQNLPDNGSAWTFNTALPLPRRFDETVTPVDSLDRPGVLHEESIRLQGSGIFATVREWLDQEPPLAQLRERSFLGGLTRVMRTAGFPRDEICRLYVLHQPGDICPPEPVGPPTAPDLVPIAAPTPPADNGPFCNLSRGAVFRVRNAGGDVAPPSTTTVDFFAFGAVNIATPNLAPNGFFDVIGTPTPPGCFEPDCEFRITVDSGNSVDEGAAGEGNNSVDGVCRSIE